LIRVVIDTNVWISAALNPERTSFKVISAMRSENGVLLFSQETFDELSTLLLRSKFDRYLSRESRTTYLNQIEAISEWVSIYGDVQGCRDPDDDKFIETALLGKADYLITGDNDLLIMSPIDHCPIIQPAEFLTELRNR